MRISLEATSGNSTNSSAAFGQNSKASDVPFIAGQMGQFKERPWDEHRKLVDKVHQQLPSKVAKTAFVSSDGLHHKGDRVHFNSESYRELGHRYFKAFMELTSTSDIDR